MGDRVEAAADRVLRGVALSGYLWLGFTKDDIARADKADKRSIPLRPKRGRAEGKYRVVVNARIGRRHKQVQTSQASCNGRECSGEE